MYSDILPHSDGDVAKLCSKAVFHSAQRSAVGDVVLCTWSTSTGTEESQTSLVSVGIEQLWYTCKYLMCNFMHNVHTKDMCMSLECA